jgi:hypothetical protein
MSDYGNTDLIRGLFRTLLGEEYFSCDNQDKSLSDAFRQALVLGTDGYPALRIAGDVVNECAELLDAYVAYRNYVISQGGIILDEVATAMIFCEGLTEARIRTILYIDYVESQGGTIVNLSKLKETFKNIT